MGRTFSRTTTVKKKQSKAKDKVFDCEGCGLYKDATTPKMNPYGNGKKNILIIGDAPTEVDDRRGSPWQAKSGRALQWALEKMGIDLHQDCISTNVLSCKCKGEPSAYQMQCCMKMKVDPLIAKIKPKVIILLGTVALQGVIGPKWKKSLGGLMKWRGFLIPDRGYRCFILPTFHPNFVSWNDTAVETVWKQDLRKAVEAVDLDLPYYPLPEIQYIEDLEILRGLEEYACMAFDYETTGIKPHAPGHRIICASIAVSPTKVYVFMMPKTKKGRKPFTDLLENPDIGKMAHNLKYEETWTINRLKIFIQNWQWDSMLAAHQLDNRTGVSGLKFQVYINFGVADYSSEIEPFLRSGGNNANAINRIHRLLETAVGTKKLLRYCAYDSYYQYLLAIKQMTEMNYQLLPF